ncbi:DUF1120 domain-containing protein [Pseudomonas fluorescens]|uniref:DUF1120 domain-containing protein n=1 Tax=Pseudomonas fluorescens TaxID=294 RepID=UPI003CFFA1C6
MKILHKTLAGLAVLASTSLPALAESVDLRVVGSITPVACTPTISGGGVVDYGVIYPNTLSATAFTALPVKDVDIFIVCEAPASVALRSRSSRAGTVAGATENGNKVATSPVKLFDTDGLGVVGLGMAGTKKIGGVAFSIDPASVMLDGIAAESLSKTWGQVDWSKNEKSKFLFDPQWTRMFTWSKKGEATPAKFTTMSGKVSAQAYINKTSELDMTKPINIDGMISLEMVYL